jgi:hypothetical protein
VESILQEPGVLVAGSEVPNLLQPDAASTLVVSQDIDIAVPVEGHGAVKARLRDIAGFTRSVEEPSVWLPIDPDLIEVNFIGMDSRGTTYVFEDDELPLLVFGHLSLLRPREPLVIEALRIPVPRPAGLVLEKLLTDRSGEKGDRDLLVALALLLVSDASDLAELDAMYRELAPEHRFAIRSSLSVISLMERRLQMPDPTAHRALIAGLMARLERAEESR